MCPHREGSPPSLTVGSREVGARCQTGEILRVSKPKVKFREIIQEKEEQVGALGPESSVSNLEGWEVRELGGRFRREGIYVYLWLMHVEV